ncbi:MAG: Os1348 family NHLP clan protein [Actinomycetia bacterium]|nr:Os1348 family NHLP clan protein [Actinomycetes bacterium]
MSSSTVNQLIERAMGDQSFRLQLMNDPDTALADHDLTAAERTALIAGDPLELEGLGVDTRLTKRLGAKWCEMCPPVTEGP